MRMPQQKYIDIVLAVVAVIIIIAIVYFVGDMVGGVVGAVLIFLGLRKTPQDKIDEAKENIEKAGDEVGPAKEHDVDSALNKFDDYFDNPH